MTTTMNSNLNMKNETVLHLPVALALAGTETTTQTAAPARKPGVSWLVPCVAVLAALIAYLALGQLAEIDRGLDALAQTMQTPQF